MEKVEFLIIGAGVVGLAIGKILSENYEDVVVVEKEKSFGRHTSSRNSEVLHSGIYYPQNTLKAKLCVEGLDLIYDFVEENNIPYNNCGKLVVATSENEINELFRLKENGEKNGSKGLSIINQEECKRLEPQIKALKALKVDSTGIIDTHKFMESLESKIEENDGFVIYNMEVASVTKQDDFYVVSFTNGEKYQANVLVNSAGLFSDKIAEMVGINITKNNLKLHWCKGEYYKNNHIKDINHLIYPLPDPTGVFLGIHLTINLNGEVRFGPNAYYIVENDYKMDHRHKTEFSDAINRYINMDEDNLHLDDCGIRSKLQEEGGTFRDFYIKEESDNGFPNFINIIGIESPGLTSCLSIAKYVESFIRRGI